MISKIYLGLFCCVLMQGTCASRQQTSHAGSTAKPAFTNARTTAAAPASTFNACTLLDKSAVASVQGTAVQQTQPSGYAYGDLDISQCYYTAISHDGKNLSVHLQLIQLNPNSAKPSAVTEFWQGRFKPEIKEHESRERDRREHAENERTEEASRVPVPLKGIGNEAFWLVSGKGGALFVRKDEKLIRISVGSAGNEQIQIEKSRTLAKQALARLT
ncbi:MAG TPA: hypothetical protein VLL54_07730 [Pyrinomonadaceae bacterium]|nr:hypothetical protein [Pyrinomonadaceae bacterium]